jgi:hypothetical protein
MDRNPGVKSGGAALLMIVWAALMLVNESCFPFHRTFHHDIASPVLALELSRGQDDIDAVLNPRSGAAVDVERQANRLDLVFIPVYTFFLWALGRRFGSRSVMMTALIVAVAGLDYWEDARIFEALDGQNPAIWIPSVAKWGLLGLVLVATGSIVARSGNTVYSLATSRLMAVGCWLAGALMIVAVAAGWYFGYSPIPLSLSIFTLIALLYAIDFVASHLRIAAINPIYVDDFRGKRQEARSQRSSP